MLVKRLVGAQAQICLLYRAWQPIPSLWNRYFFLSQKRSKKNVATPHIFKPAKCPKLTVVNVRYPGIERCNTSICVLGLFEHSTRSYLGIFQLPAVQKFCICIYIRWLFDTGLLHSRPLATPPMPVTWLTNQTVLQSTLTRTQLFTALLNIKK